MDATGLGVQEQTQQVAGLSGGCLDNKEGLTGCPVSNEAPHDSPQQLHIWRSGTWIATPAFSGRFCGINIPVC